jgi:peroxidase
LANVTYKEFLPKLLGRSVIDRYDGYKAKVDPRISEEFAGAAYRFGHSLVSAETERIDNNGELIGSGSTLRGTFFITPAAFAADTGADGFLRHLLSDASQAMDARIVDDLRNFLFDPPVGLDLAAINIQRGRDLGLGTLNQTRESLGLTSYKTFEQITRDAWDRRGDEAGVRLRRQSGPVDGRASRVPRGRRHGRGNFQVHYRRSIRATARW